MIFSDLVLPGLDGFKLARRLRDQTRFDRTVMFALSGLTTDESIEEAIKSGFEYFATKPMEPEMFLESVHATRQDSLILFERTSNIQKQGADAQGRRAFSAQFDDPTTEHGNPEEVERPPLLLDVSRLPFVQTRTTGGPLMVLIIDDHPDTRDSLALCLSMQGYGVFVAASREDGVTILSQQTEIHCVLLDYNMPGMSCQDFLSIVRRDHAQANCILMSAGSEIREIARSLGVSDWIRKPADFDSVFKLVAKYGHLAPPTKMP